MITNIKVKNFKAVPYLETSLLMQNHPKGISFSRKKVNVIVGPNGAGKSALLEAMALQTLSWYSGQTTLDDNYIRGTESDEYWTRPRGWGERYEFLKGLDVKTDNAAALYYRPGHLPGNESSITHAMMCGYMEEAKEYGRLTQSRSSGQKCQALLEKMNDVLAGKKASLGYAYANWRAGKDAKDLNGVRSPLPWDITAEILKERARGVSAEAIPMVIMDEPEQSLDAKAEVRLWKLLEAVDCTSVQVIVASHSLYPLLNQDRFNLIEAVAGYANEVHCELLSEA